MPRQSPQLAPKSLHVTAPARAEIDQTLRHFASEAGIEVPLRFADKIDVDLFRLAATGHSGVTREWLSPGLRTHVLGDYCVYFRVTDTETCIVRFLHGHRDVSAIMFDPNGLD